MRGATGTPLRSGAANSMKTCRFDEIDLRGGTSILVDLTSLQKFADDFRSKWLTDERAVSVYADKLTDGDPWCQQLFEVLSNFICFDQFIVDRRALYSFEDAELLLKSLGGSGLEEHFSSIIFPVQAYISAAENISRVRDVLINNLSRQERQRLDKIIKKRTPHLEEVLGYEETRFVDDNALKDMYDRRLSLPEPDFDSSDLPRYLAETGLSVERLFVYLEFARLLEIPATLARTKYKAADQVGIRIRRAVDRVMKKEVDRLRSRAGSGLEQVQDIVRGSALPKVALMVPPLPGHIIRVAKDRNCGVLDAVKTIRNNENASAFRRYLWDARGYFNPTFAFDHLKFKELRKELTELGKRIATGSISRDYRKVTCRISKVPQVGWILDMLGLGKINVPVSWSRSVPLYETFIAEWFTYQPKERAG